MDEHAPESMTAEELPVVEETSTEYLGRWNRLISTTNWEKGRIISGWRKALIAADVPAESHTDEAWSRRVGNISPQHVGRLRRVYQRFGDVYDGYKGLYWSHFQAALDWPDPELWLEGAVQNGWSVNQMRNQRWEAIGAPPDKKPRPEDIIATELDEDVFAGIDGDVPETISGSVSEVQPDDGFDESPLSEANSLAASAEVDPLRPFEDIPSLPSDLNEAFEAFKLAILAHKVAGWRDISCDDVLVVLNALKQLALAPAES